MDSLTYGFYDCPGLSSTTKLGPSEGMGYRYQNA